MSWVRRRRIVVLALAVGLVGAGALTLTHRSQPLPLARAQAITAALRTRAIHLALAGVSQPTIRVDAVDPRLERVTFLHNGQVLGEAALRPDGRVVQALDFRRLAVPYGDWIAYQPALLIGLALLFVLMAGVAPWRRMRNLDVLAALTLVAPILLLQHHYVDASVLAALPGLLYLMVRCALRGLGSNRPSAHSLALIDAITPGWDQRRRIRMMRILLGGLVLAFVMITVSSVDAVDVLYAVMEGATKLVGGVLPYGHMPGDVIHGDTYPLLSYALYTPLAWLTPVRDNWDSVDLALGVTVGAVLAAGWALFRAIAGARSRGSARALEREAAGLRAALCWLAFPPVLVVASSGTSDVVLAAMLALALLLWRRPGLCTGWLAAAAWFKLAPLVLLPLRLASLRGRPLLRALMGIGLVTLPMLALLLALGGSGGPMAMIHAVAFQFSRGSPQSVWAALGIENLQPLGEGAVLALLAGAVLALRSRPELGEDRVRMAALSAALLIGLQLAANYWAFLYVVWVAPLLVLSVLAEGSPQTAAMPIEARVTRARQIHPAGAPA